jgi:hypothetical protein
VPSQLLCSAARAANTEKQRAARAVNARKGGRPKLAWERKLEWTTTRIYATARGWIIEHDSRIQGDSTGTRYALDYTADIPHGQDLDAPWNGGLTYADILIDRQVTGRCLRRGQIVQ